MIYRSKSAQNTWEMIYDETSTKLGGVDDIAARAKIQCVDATTEQLEVYSESNILLDIDLDAASAWISKFAIVELQRRRYKQHILDQVLQDSNDEAGLSNIIDL